MKKVLYHSLVLIVMLMFAWSCREDNITGEDDLTIPHETLVVNDWIKDNMNLYYFWNDKIATGIDFTKEPDSEVYFA